MSKPKMETLIKLIKERNKLYVAVAEAQSRLQDLDEQIGVARQEAMHEAATTLNDPIVMDGFVYTPKPLR